MERGSSVAGEDKYRSFLIETIEWRHGGPPSYDAVNLLFEQGRTKVWNKGSLEEIVQNAIKSWEMEISHKIHVQDMRTINPEKFRLIVNGKEGLTAEETLRVGTYNALLKNSLPEELKWYKAEEESFESSHSIFRSAFPRGFAWEVLAVYSEPPVITFKFRHWGFFEGPFRGHSPTGDIIQFFGMAILKVDESLKAEEVEIYYDPAHMFEGLLKGPTTTSEGEEGSPKKHQQSTFHHGTGQLCPFHNTS